MADQHINFGGTFDVESGSANKIFFDHVAADRRGSIVNKGAVRIYIGFNTNDVNANEDPEDGKIWCDPGQAARIPRKCDFIAVKTPSSVSKGFYIED